MNIPPSRRVCYQLVCDPVNLGHFIRNRGGRFNQGINQGFARGVDHGQLYDLGPVIQAGGFRVQEEGIRSQTFSADLAPGMRR